MCSRRGAQKGKASDDGVRTGFRRWRPAAGYPEWLPEMLISASAVRNRLVAGKQHTLWQAERRRKTSSLDRVAGFVFKEQIVFVPYKRRSSPGSAPIFWVLQGVEARLRKSITRAPRRGVDHHHPGSRSDRRLRDWQVVVFVGQRTVQGDHVRDSLYSVARSTYSTP